MFVMPWTLRKRGILGMNRRNISYISRYNERRLFPLVDNKLKTKVLAEAACINTPKLIGLVESQYDVTRLDEILEGINGFAIKPANGSGGKGIMVLKRNAEGEFVKSSGSVVRSEEHTSELQSRPHLVCRLLLEKKKKKKRKEHNT